MASIKFDAPKLLREWFESEKQLFSDKKIEANLRLPAEGENLNKALATFETAFHVASLTIWGTGMLEFIVLDVAAQNEVVVVDRELDSAGETIAELNKSAAEFVRIVQAS